MRAFLGAGRCVRRVGTHSLCMARFWGSGWRQGGTGGRGGGGGMGDGGWWSRVSLAWKGWMMVVGGCG